MLFLTDDPSEAIKLLREAEPSKLERWAMFLDLVITDDTAAMVASDMFDEAYTIEYIRDEARRTAIAIRTHLNALVQ